MEEIKCNYCKEQKKDYNFYKIVYQKLNHDTNKYEDFNICKSCFLEYFFSIENNDFCIDLKNLCKEFNMVFDIKLFNIINNKRENLKSKLLEYIKCISSLKQYYGKEYRDSIFVDSRDNNKSEKNSDLDFINYDIEKIKKNIESASNRGDANLHGKWLNSLRDAIELRNKLENTNNIPINNTIVVNKNINEDDIKNIIKNMKYRDYILPTFKKDCNYKNGDYIKINNKTYIIAENNKLQECNYSIKWADQNNKIYEFPCAVDNVDNYGRKIMSSLNVSIEDKYKFKIQNNEYTLKYLQQGFRFILYNDKNEIYKINDTYLLEDGIINITCEKSYIRDEDDIENRIAYNIF